MSVPSQKQQIRALFDAYIEASGLCIAYSNSRESTLREFVRRNIQPADILWVLKVLQGRIDRGVSGYTLSSMEWHNAMDPDTFEDRLALLRRERDRRRRKPATESAHTHRLPDGGTITVLAPTPEPEAAAIAASVKEQAAALRRQLRHES